MKRTYFTEDDRLKLVNAAKAEFRKLLDQLDDAHRRGEITRREKKSRRIIGIIKLHDIEKARRRPIIVCLCGSTRFRDEFFEAMADLTLAGQMVLAPGVWVRSSPEYADLHGTQTKADLDELHKRKIDLADYVYVINVDGYIGESTRSEIDYATENAKPVYYLEPLEVPGA